MAREIAVTRRQVVAALAALASVIALGTGWLDSPRDSGGHPLLLTRENLAIKRYLERAVQWSRTMGQAQQSLADVLPASGAAHSAPGNLYQHARIARETREQLAEIARQIASDDTPPALAGLHALARVASDAQSAYASAVLNAVAVPDTERLDLAYRSGVQAADSLRALRQALARQNGGDGHE